MQINSVEFLAALVNLLLHNIDEGIHVTNEQGTTLYYNSSAGRIDGIGCDEAVGKHVLELFPSLNDQTSTLLLALKGGNPVQKLRQHISNLHGTNVLLESTTLPLKVGDLIVGAVDISRDLTQVKALSDQVVDLQSKQAGARGRVQQDRAVFRLEDLIGISPALQGVKERALRVARTSSPVMVTGETGTGKELLVQGIHNASSRRTGPFIAQNCAAIPASLMEGILFGTVKGCFTGAENRPGLVELADGGTLLLDEITCLDIDLQSKLLRFIQDGCVRRLGEGKNRKVDVRIIASTNIDPVKAVNTGLLRPDLYYRLNVVNIVLPPLRERKEDIVLLADHFLAELNLQLGTQVRGWSKNVELALQSYDWPGNVRELRGAIEGAMNTANDQILQLQDLPEYLFVQVEEKVQEVSLSELQNLTLPQALARVEKWFIAQALSHSGGNITQAAKQLGIPRQTLQYKLKS